MLARLPSGKYLRIAFSSHWISIQPASLPLKGEIPPVRVYQYVITFDDMEGNAGLTKINLDDPNRALLRALVKWGMGFSAPYIASIEVNGEMIIVNVRGLDDETLPDSAPMQSFMATACIEAGLMPSPS
jgi:hypothetical protein